LVEWGVVWTNKKSTYLASSRANTAMNEHRSRHDT
jgi:hypothetical protein